MASKGNIEKLSLDYLKSVFLKMGSVKIKRLENGNGQFAFIGVWGYTEAINVEDYLPNSDGKLSTTFILQKTLDKNHKAAKLSVER